MAPRERFHAPPSVYGTYSTDSDSSGCMASPHRKERKNLSVRFKRFPIQRPVETWRLYSPAERSRVWYAAADYQRFKESCKRIIDHTITQGFTSGVHYHDDNRPSFLCARGLEKYTVEGTQRYQQRHSKLMKDVSLLCGFGVCTADELAIILSAQTAPCRTEARDRALDDERFARWYASTNDQPADSSSLDESSELISKIQSRLRGRRHPQPAEC